MFHSHCLKIIVESFCSASICLFGVAFDVFNYVITVVKSFAICSALSIGFSIGVLQCVG